MNEAMTWSFLPKAHAELFGGGRTRWRLPTRSPPSFPIMRPSLLPEPDRRRRAQHGAWLRRCGALRGRPDLWRRPAAGRAALGLRRPPRHECAAPLGGQRAAPSMSSTPRPMRSRCSPPSARRSTGCAPSRKARPGIIPGRVGSLMLGPKNRAGVFGEIHPRVLSAMDVAGPLVAFEVDLDARPAAEERADGAPARSTPRSSRR